MAEGTKVKICGLMRRQDAAAADAYGADYLGVVLSAGFGRSVEPERARALVEGLTAVPVAVLVDEEADSASRLAAALGAGVVQLHGKEPPAVVAEIGERGPWRVWKSVRARAPEDVSRALDAYAGLIDGILLEGYREGVVGGGGAMLDLDALYEVRARIPAELEVVLAGGLTPDAVRAALARFAPDVIDVSSGVERARGEKDHHLVRRFIEEARGRPAPFGSNASPPIQGDFS